MVVEPKIEFLPIRSHRHGEKRQVGYTPPKQLLRFDRPPRQPVGVSCNLELQTGLGIALNFTRD